MPKKMSRTWRYTWLCWSCH